MPARSRTRPAGGTTTTPPRPAPAAPRPATTPALGAYHAGSLEDSPGGRDNDDPLLSVLGCDEAGYHRVEQRIVLDSMLACLTRRERDVVRLRFEHDLTQAKIAEKVGISQMQVSRILRRSLDRLREVLTKDAAARDEIPRAA